MSSLIWYLKRKVGKKFSIVTEWVKIIKLKCQGVIALEINF